MIRFTTRAIPSWPGVTANQSTFEGPITQAQVDAVERLRVCQQPQQRHGFMIIPGQFIYTVFNTLGTPN